MNNPTDLSGRIQTLKIQQWLLGSQHQKAKWVLTPINDQQQEVDPDDASDETQTISILVQKLKLPENMTEQEVTHYMQQTYPQLEQNNAWWFAIGELVMLNKHWQQHIAPKLTKQTAPGNHDPSNTVSKRSVGQFEHRRNLANSMRTERLLAAEKMLEPHLFSSTTRSLFWQEAPPVRDPEKNELTRWHEKKFYPPLNTQEPDNELLAIMGALYRNAIIASYKPEQLTQNEQVRCITNDAGEITAVHLHQDAYDKLKEYVIREKLLLKECGNSIWQEVDRQTSTGIDIHPVASLKPLGYGRAYPEPLVLALNSETQFTTFGDILASTLKRQGVVLGTGAMFDVSQPANVWVTPTAYSACIQPIAGRENSLKR